MSDGWVLFRPVPVRSSLITRPRLLSPELVPLTLLAAPAGFGKSTLLSEWARQWENQRIATFWLTLGEHPVSESDLWRLLCRSLCLDLSSDSAVKPTPQAISDYLSELEREVVVVIDNYENATSPSLDFKLAGLLDSSLYLNLVISGRRLASLAGPLVTSRYTTRTITADELAFTGPEAGELARLHNRSVARISEFAEAVAGWPIAVTSACGSPDDPLKTLASLVAQQVGTAVEQGTAEVLSVIALCPGISVTAVNEYLLNHPGANPLSAQEACSSLERLGLIVKLSTHDGDRYGCERGVALAIGRQARSSFTDAEIASLRGLYARDIEPDNPIQAFKVLLDLEDFEAAEQLARRNFIGLLTDVGATRTALNTVSPDATNTFVALDGLRLFVDQSDTAISTDLRWERMQERRVMMARLLNGSDTDSMLYMACSLMSADVMLGNVDAAYRMAQDLDRRLNQLGDGRLPGQRELRALVRSLTGFSCAAAGEYTTAEHDYRASLQLAERSDVLPLKVRAHRGLALVDYCLGKLADAQEHLTECRELETSWLDSGGSGPLDIADVDVQMEALIGPLSTSGWRPESELQPVSGEVMDSLNRAVSYPFLLIAEAEVDRRLNGDIHASRQLLHRLRYWPDRKAETNAFRRRLQRYTADLLTVIGDVAGAKRQLAGLPENSPAKHLSVARINLFQGNARAAVVELGIHEGESLIPGLQLDRHLLAAIALWQMEQRDAAAEVFLEVQRRMRDTAGFNSLTWVPYAPLLALAEFTRSAGAEAIYEWVCAVPQNLRCLQYEALSKAELRSLAGLSAGKSLEETAGTLYISINTLKFHLRSIYRKLQVSNRNEAVLRGQMLGLISSVPHQNI